MPQNRTQSSTMHREKRMAHKGNFAQFAPVLRNFGSRFLQLGPVIHSLVFWQQRWLLKSFLSRWASIQVANNAKGHHNRMSCLRALHLQLMVGSPAPFRNDLSNFPTPRHSISSPHILYIVYILFANGWLAGNFWEIVGEKLYFSTL